MEHDDAVENVSEHQVDPAEDIAEPDAKMAIKCTFWGLVWPQMRKNYHRWKLCIAIFK